ncbi:MAG: hypothetical protein NWQ17_04930, partial [Polaribacter sp.]|nr:hypothetical protein [Polaribacter sp.]
MTKEKNNRLHKWLKVLKFFAAYLVAAWTFLQFVDWLLIRYNISPYWVDIQLWFFIGISPSLIIYLYNQDRINERILKLHEKIIFPLNIILLITVLYFSFSSSDLGATTTSVDYTNEKGEQKTAFITKEEFRKNFNIANFEPKTKDSANAWMEFGISKLLLEDLAQNKNLKAYPLSAKNTTDKINYANLYGDTYVDGEFEIIDSTYIITTFIRNSVNANIIKQETLKGKDLLDLIDDISIFVTNQYSNSSNEFNTPIYADLKVKEFTSNSLKAIEYYINEDYSNAIKEDSTFALAYLDYGKYNLFYNSSEFDKIYLADNAYKNRARLPIQKRAETLILRYLAYDQHKDAEELVKLQLEVDPNDDVYNGMLYNIYVKTKNLKAYTQLAYNSYKNNPTPANGFNFANAALFNEDYDEFLSVIHKLELLQPNNKQLIMLKIMPLLLKGDILKAEKTQKKVKLLNPDYENVTKVYDKAISYLKNRQVTKVDLQKFEGEYRSIGSELIFNFFIKNNTLLKLNSNQGISPTVMSSGNAVISGYAIAESTIEYTFLRDQTNAIYGMKSEQNTLSDSRQYWYLKIDSNIKKAETLFKSKKLDSAKIAYTTAIKLNPKHFYLKDVLQHINYIQSVDASTLQNQYKDIVGTYGPRKIWLEKDKLFYKRDNQPQIELL